LSLRRCPPIHAPRCRSLAHSGSAFPATLAFQIRELERETARALALDAIVTVIDAENFAGYEDTSVTARMQPQYPHLLLIVRCPTPPPLPVR